MRNLNRKQRSKSYRLPRSSRALTYTIDLQSFREALAVLQRQVDELDDLKASHYQEILEHEEEVWDVVQNKVCSSKIYTYIYPCLQQPRPTCIGLHCRPLDYGRIRPIYCKSVCDVTLEVFSSHC
jgi:hypothetical protein